MIRRWLAALLDVRWQSFLLLLVLIILLVAGLNPFNFFPKNQVSWLIDAPGVLFHRYGEVVGPSPLMNMGVAGAQGWESGVTVELWVASLNEEPYVKDLLSFYVSRRREPFAVEEWGKRLIIGGIFRDTRGHRKFQHIGIDDAFAHGARRFITFTSGPDGSRIYIDGKLREDVPGLTLEPVNFDGTMLLGQTASARQEWRGAFLGLALYRKEFTADEAAASFNDWQRHDTEACRRRAPEAAIYPFDEAGGKIVHNHGNLGADLTIPKLHRPVDPIILAIPHKQDLEDWSDVVINLLGFIPFGILLVLYFRSRRWPIARSFLVTIASGFFLSLFIELLQVFLPSRDSSLLDVINNTLGTAMGAGLAVWMLPYLKRIATTAGRPSIVTR